jgi:hypothetical protein
LAKRRAGRLFAYPYKAHFKQTCVNYRLTEEDARAALAAMQATRSNQSGQPAFEQSQHVDKTVTGQTEDSTTLEMMSSNTDASSGNTRPAAKKKAAKPKLTAKERKERNVCIDNLLFFSFFSTNPNSWKSRR